MKLSFPAARADALNAWQEFIPKVTAYAKNRNHVIDGHQHVSCLSPAIRHRLISEDEILLDTLRHHRFDRAEKWLQEVCWRRYWKGWLEMHPDVWDNWQDRVKVLTESLPKNVLDRAAAVARGESGVAVMDAFAHELIKTGYLHNHARMWWASFWIHVEKLPWELGAEFFYRHLLDADPASNTCSWRWVAGLQTPGKTYLVRKSNIERYAPHLLEKYSSGSDALDDEKTAPQLAQETALMARHALPTLANDYRQPLEQKIGIWLHMDDLLLETSPLTDVSPVAIAATSARSALDSTVKSRYLENAFGDAILRTKKHFNHAPTVILDEVYAPQMAAWAKEHRLDQVVALAACVGPTRDQMPAIESALTAIGCSCHWIRRPSDQRAFSIAGAGFFPFWKKMERHLRELAASPEFPFGK